MTSPIECVHQHEKAKAKRHQLVAKLLLSYQVDRPDEVQRVCCSIRLQREKFDAWINSPSGAFYMTAARSEYISFIQLLMRNEGISCECSSNRPAPAYSHYVEFPVTLH